MPTGAQYATLHIKNWMNKIQTYAGLAQENGSSPAVLLSLV
jgi:hypothetical protein